jgi:hypothetical protein
MYRTYLLSLNEKEYEQAFVIMKGKTICGYTYMFYEDYENKDKKDHNIYLYVTLGENHAYSDAFKIAFEKAKQFYNENKKEHRLEKIKFYINENLMIKEQFDFYKRILRNLDFKSDDEELFYLDLE